MWWNPDIDEKSWKNKSLPKDLLKMMTQLSKSFPIPKVTHIVTSHKKLKNHTKRFSS
jgi:hypothetical protein